MKKYLIHTLFICSLISGLTAFGLAGSGSAVFGLAQAQDIKIGFVNPNALLAAHPAGEAAAALVKQRDDELAPILSEIQTLQQKAETVEGLSADERARATLLVRTVEEVRKRYSADIQAASAPAVEAINIAVTAVAQAGGYTLVLDGELSGQAGLGLVVYVDPSKAADITEQVIAQMNGQ